ncbi:MAG: uracil-DNA glycosylase [bacterium]|nr:uracil-DNA glycosylase [bacterium]
MPHPSDQSTLRSKVAAYFQLLSEYERELYHDPDLKREPPAGGKVLKSAVSTPAKGLNPYPSYAPYDSLTAMNESISGCLRCGLGPTRTKFVFGTGSKNARVVFIGEAPGAEEDRRGEPFVGRAGELLNSMLREIDWRREDVYICNVLKCRPPNNRDPLPEEVTLCEPYLHEQLRILDPEWLVSLGRISAQALLRTTAPLKALRGVVHRYREKPLWVTYHPAALLRNQNLMPDAHQDLLTLQRMIAAGAYQP